MQKPLFRAITTRYKGYAFRSRLEARWAVFFDHLGIRWEYEPEGFELGNGLRYLPDFWLPDWKMWVEVKPDEPDDVAREKAFRLALHSGAAVLITCGMPETPGTLYVTCTQQGGEVGLWDFRTIVSWTTPFIMVNGPRDFDQKPAVPIVPRAGAMPSDIAARDFVEFNCRAALQAARSARFEFGQKGTA